MGELDLRHTLGEVQAPPGFERMVLARIHEIKAGTRPAAVRSFRPKLAWAGALAALLVCAVVINFVVLPRGGGVSQAALETGGGAGQTIPVMDSVDYGREVRTVSGDASTVYILEQVSDSGTYGNIRY